MSLFVFTQALESSPPTAPVSAGCVLGSRLPSANPTITVDIRSDVLLKAFDECPKKPSGIEHLLLEGIDSRIQRGGSLAVVGLAVST